VDHRNSRNNKRRRKVREEPGDRGFKPRKKKVRNCQEWVPWNEIGQRGKGNNARKREKGAWVSYLRNKGQGFKKDKNAQGGNSEIA